MIIPLGEKKLPETCFIFKHSTSCPISSDAADEIRSVEARHPVYWINVIEQRGLSDWVEESYGIRHESPQLLLVENGAVSDSWSHTKIKRDLVVEK